MNEEDIKILEEWITFKNQFNLYPGELEIISAIENLINRNKELEEENRIFALEGSKVSLKMHIDKNYIPKSKIKEKIKELKQEYKIELEKNSIKAFILKCKIEVLEELLQEGENNGR